MTPFTSSTIAVNGGGGASSFSFFSSSKTPTVLPFCPKSQPKPRLLSFPSRPPNAPYASRCLSLARRWISPVAKASGDDFLAPRREAPHATFDATAGDHHPVASTADEDAEGQDAVAPDVNGSRQHNGFECLGDPSSMGGSTDEENKEVVILKNKPWTVPWKIETIIQVMLLWIASFWFVGSWIIPIVAHAAGFSKESLTYRGQALYSLLTDIFEGLAGIAILYRCLAKFRPLPSGWFHFSLKGSWHFDVGLGCLLFPLVNFLSQVNINLVPALPSPPVGVSSVEQSIVARDPVAMVLYAVVVSVCAPVWEEIIFRGFLLPSLTRYMPLWSSVLVSAVAFALAHFNVQRLLPLVLLGVVMGAVFARSRNLLASILLHSLWNGFVFLDLMK